MFKNIFFILFPIFVYGRKAAFQQELRRQYDDFKNRLNKVETPLSFETFVYNLNTIENFNEVIDVNAKWAEGYNGFLQYLCLKIICEKLKDE